MIQFAARPGVFGAADFLLVSILLLFILPLSLIVPSARAAETVRHTPRFLSAAEPSATETADSAWPETLTPEEQAFIEKVNAERTERGLNALTVDARLVRTARAHSREMDAQGYFSHRSPTPGLATPMGRYLTGLREEGLSPPVSLLIGENIYYCSVFNDIYNVDYGHRALMDSPGHRANLLDPRFTRIGVGVCRDVRGRFWVTEMFLTERVTPGHAGPSSAAFSDSPT